MISFKEIGNTLFSAFISSINIADTRPDRLHFVLLYATPVATFLPEIPICEEVQFILNGGGCIKDQVPVTSRWRLWSRLRSGFWSGFWSGLRFRLWFGLWFGLWFRVWPAACISHSI